MEDFTPLTITCKQMNMEIKEPYIQKLKKQKHAAHQANYRLKEELRKLKITNQLLSGIIVIIAKHNENMLQSIQSYTSRMTSE